MDFISSISYFFICTHILYLSRLNNWLNDNINVFGSENIFVVNIINASIIKLEIEKENKKKYEKNTEFFYEINFALEFILKDDNNSILSKTLVNSKRSTTSDKSISLNQKEQIIDILILESIRDITKKADTCKTTDELKALKVTE